MAVANAAFHSRFRSETALSTAAPDRAKRSEFRPADLRATVFLTCDFGPVAEPVRVGPTAGERGADAVPQLCLCLALRQRPARLFSPPTRRSSFPPRLERQARDIAAPQRQSAPWGYAPGRPFRGRRPKDPFRRVSGRRRPLLPNSSGGHPVPHRAAVGAIMRLVFGAGISFCENGGVPPVCAKVVPEAGTHAHNLPREGRSRAEKPLRAGVNRRYADSGTLGR
jgi:hypothetical protein